MKKKLAALLLAAMMVLSTAGCQSAQQESGTEESSAQTETTTEESASSQVKPNEGEPDAEQYINTSLSAEPSVLDVARFTTVTDRTVFYNILEPLTRIQDSTVVPAGAESWDVSEDGLIYTFHLRENYWSDGQKVTAEDYASALRRQATPSNAFVFASDYSNIKNFSEAQKGEVDASEIGVEVIDENTLQITLTAATPALLSTVDFFPQRQDYADEHGDKLGTEADTVISCGPFVLTEWVHNSQLSFEKNEQYWNKDNVQLQEVNFLIIDDTTAEYSSFENGSIDYINISDADYIEKFRSSGSYVEEPYSAARTVMIVFNCQDEVFSNEKIRQAFSLAIDRESISEVLNNGLTTPAYGIIPAESSVGSLNYRENVEEPLKQLQAENPDPQALLIEGMKELGLGEDPSALTVTFAMGGTNAKTRSTAEYYQQMWQGVLGVTVELEFNDTATHMSNINSGSYQMAMTNWGANVEPQFMLSRWSSESGGQSKWINEEYRELVNTAATTEDEQERLDLYAQAENLLITEAAIAPICYNGSLRFSYPCIIGLDNNPFDTMGMQTVYTVGRE